VPRRATNAARPPAATDALFDCDDPDDYYRFGVDTFLAGVRALQARLAPSPA
jgi:hypothetical protein